MGIKNIKKLLEKYPGVIRTESITDLVDSRIAVDTPIYLSKYLYITLRDHFSNYSDEDILSFEELNSEVRREIVDQVINRFMESFEIYSRVTGANFVMILEGPKTPEIKSHYAGARRLRDCDRFRERYRIYRRDCNVEGIRKVIGLIQDISLTELTERLYEVIEKSAYECIKADGESERMACILRENQMVDHVLTTDTDCLAMKQSMIINIDSRALEYTFIDYQQALENLSLTESQFTDLCIMSGCDYNDNIPRIGVMKAYKMIQEHGNIENVGQVKDITILNHEVCRRLFCLLE